MRCDVLSLAIAGLFILLASPQAQAQTITFTATLHGGNEVPVVVTGSVRHRHRDAGTLADQDGHYAVDVYNLPVGTTAGAHPCRRAGRRRAGGGQLRCARRARSRTTSRSGHVRLHRRRGAPSRRASTRAKTSSRRCCWAHLRERPLDVNPGGEIRGQLIRSSNAVGSKVRVQQFKGSPWFTEPVNSLNRLERPLNALNRRAASG